VSSSIPQKHWVAQPGSAMQAVLSEMGCQMTEQSWPDQWYFKEERRLKPSSEKVSSYFSPAMKLLLALKEGHD